MVHTFLLSISALFVPAFCSKQGKQNLWCEGSMGHTIMTAFFGDCRHNEQLPSLPSVRTWLRQRGERLRLFRYPRAWAASKYSYRGFLSLSPLAPGASVAEGEAPPQRAKKPGTTPGGAVTTRRGGSLDAGAASAAAVLARSFCFR